jgi:hypothetical protein
MARDLHNQAALKSHSVSLNCDEAGSAFSSHQWIGVIMNSGTCTTAIGVFANWDKAEAAVEDLRSRGFHESEIGIVSRDAKIVSASRSEDDIDLEDDEADDVVAGSLTGAAAGAGIGGLIGLGVLSGMIPVVGPALFAGTLGVLASNAAGGAAVAGLIGALTAWGFSEEEAKHYQNEIAAGRVVVTVNAGRRCGEARSILQSHGATTRETASTTSLA